ncbi:hypothetical protein [uncultured Ruegeria sp.]|uniref:hypothetical protein n=1 Tax=uncultured Ruegeria sp. TaxID=259304 RepID=UPI0026118AC0|nr:hypothetical protein [uncultured Ruegeria sp.]
MTNITNLHQFDSTPIPFTTYVAGGIWEGLSKAALAAAYIAFVFAFSLQGGNSSGWQVPFPSQSVSLPAGASMEASQ